MGLLSLDHQLPWGKGSFSALEGLSRAPIQDTSSDVGAMTMSLRVQVTLGDFRRKTADLPDDTAIFIEYEDCHDWHEISDLDMKYLPPVPIMDVPGALILEGGQQFDEEHYIGERFDVYLDCGDWDALKK